MCALCRREGGDVQMTSAPERGRFGPGQGNPRISSVCFTPRAEGSGVDSDILSCLESFSPNVAFFAAVVSILADAVLIFPINTASSVSFQ